MRCVGESAALLQKTKLNSRGPERRGEKKTKKTLCYLRLFGLEAGEGGGLARGTKSPLLKEETTLEGDLLPPPKIILLLTEVSSLSRAFDESS